MEESNQQHLWTDGEDTVSAESAAGAREVWRKHYLIDDHELPNHPQLRFNQIVDDARISVIVTTYNYVRVPNEVFIRESHRKRECIVTATAKEWAEARPNQFFSIHEED